MNKYVLDTSKYTFDASTRTITFVDDITVQEILVITNVTDGIIIYNFACEGFTGELSGKILTLEFDTRSMSDTDDLLVILQQNDTSVEDGLADVTTVSNRQQVTLANILEELKLTNKLLGKIYDHE